MTALDSRISRLYRETYGNVHASDELRNRILNMTAKKQTKRKITKVICAVAAAVILVMAGTIAVSASRIEYDTVMFNGVEKKARYVDFRTGTRMWELIDKNEVGVYGRDWDLDEEIVEYVTFDGDGELTIELREEA